MVTNQQVQDKFRDFMDGDKIEWQLLKMFFHQNGGFSRKTASGEKAIGMTVNADGGYITVSIMTLETEDGDLIAQEDEAIKIDVDDKVENRLLEMVRRSSGNSELGINDPDNSDGMYS